VSTATHVLDPALAPERILSQLPAEVRRLVIIVATLYGGSWDSCAEDVRRRQAGKPYLYRVDIPGVDALAWLHRLHAYETARGEPLAVPSLETAENRL
jgi:hypothetical protein